MTTARMLGEVRRIIRVILGHIERTHLGMTNAEAPAA